MTRSFSEVKGFHQVFRLLGTLSPGVPVDVEPGGDVLAESNYGNHLSAEGHAEAIRVSKRREKSYKERRIRKRKAIRTCLMLKVDVPGCVGGCGSADANELAAA